MLIETGGSTAESARRSDATEPGDDRSRTIGMKSSESQALPPSPTVRRSRCAATSTPNHSKNMKMKSRIAETPAIFSPVLEPVYVHLISSVETWGSTAADTTPALGRRATY